MTLITVYHGKSTKKLSFSEKDSIIYADPDTLLNIKTELISKSCDRNNFLLAKVKK